MPQIGWLEILIIVSIAIIVVGPKDFPIMLKKIGNWFGSIKRYFNEIQTDMKGMKNVTEDEISIQEEKLNQTKDIKKDE